MFTFDITAFVPDFILQDRNGLALARAEQKGLSLLLSDMLSGFAMLEDPQAMPEWRLDEAAWETGCLYDYSAEPEQKRAWISSALRSRTHTGTPAGLRRMIEGYITDALVEEWFDYGGDPYHFRLAVSGTVTQDSLKWARRAVELAGNLRSVMDSLVLASTAAIEVSAAFEVIAVCDLPMLGEDHYYGEEL